MLTPESQRDAVHSLLQLADFGIEDILLKETSYPKGMPDWIKQPGKEVRFRMKGTQGTATLSLDQQSAGTKTFLDHLPVVLGCLRRGRPMVVDELESNLHPNLARHIVGLFQNQPLGCTIAVHYAQHFIAWQQQ
jgi:hypothetical protein